LIKRSTPSANIPKRTMSLTRTGWFEKANW
jgi:hypothetical protein